MKKITVIIFTYKRAMLLHNCLETLISNFKNIDNSIHIIYHPDKVHESSYEKLKENFKNYNIKFYKRKKANLFSWIFKILRPLNLLWLLRWPIIFREMNNFKNILENILEHTSSDFVTLCPDDMIYFDKTSIPETALNKILENPIKFQYRYFTSDNFKKPHNLSKDLNITYYKDVSDQNYFSWSFKDKHASGVWKYRFTIEGTIYERKALLKFLRPFIYHNPITLEAIGLWEARFRDFFFEGLSSSRRTAATYQVNNVQKIVNTPSANYDETILMNAYNNNYKLLYEKKDFYKNEHDTTPERLKFINIKNLQEIDYKKLKEKFNY